MQKFSFTIRRDSAGFLGGAICQWASKLARMSQPPQKGVEIASRMDLPCDVLARFPCDVLDNSRPGSRSQGEVVEIFGIEKRPQRSEPKSHSSHCAVGTIRLERQCYKLNHSVAERRPKRYQVFSRTTVDAIGDPPAARWLKFGDYPKIGFGRNFREAVQESGYVIPKAGCEGNLDPLTQMMDRGSNWPA